MDKKPFEYLGTRIDTNDEIGGDYLQKDAVFGWKIINTSGEYRVHADSIKKFCGTDESGGYVYRSWKP